MLLAIDIGNTNLVIGCFENDKILFKARIATDHTRTSDQYGVEIKSMLEAYGARISDIDDCIISSVVPPVFNSVRTGVMKVIGKQPMVVGPGLKTGLNIHVDVPSQVGSDRIVIAVAALAESLPRMRLSIYSPVPPAMMAVFPRATMSSTMGAAMAQYRDTEKSSSGSATSIIWWGIPCISSGLGLAVPMSMRR